MLKQIEIWASRIVERDDLTVDYGIFGKLAKRLINERILTVERFSFSRIEAQFDVRVNGQCTLSI